MVLRQALAGLLLVLLRALHLITHLVYKFLRAKAQLHRVLNRVIRKLNYVRHKSSFTIPSRVPSSVAVVLSCFESKIDLHELAKLVVWMVSIQVRSISLYDPKGYLKSHAQDLSSELSYRHKSSQDNLVTSESRELIKVGRDSHELVSSPMTVVAAQIHLHNSKEILLDQIGDTLEVNLNIQSITPIQTQKVDIHLLSEEDGKQALANVANYLLSRPEQHASNEIRIASPGAVVQNGQMRGDISHRGAINSLLTENDIDKALSRLGEYYKEPDLILVFGEVLTLDGFPPWSSRLSEIMFMGPLESLSFSSFHKALLHFAGTNQRLGR